MSAVRELIAALVAGGMSPVDAATMAVHAAVEMSGPKPRKAGADRMAEYRDRREAMGLPRIFPSHVFRPQLVERDGDRCIYCEATDGLVIDHIQPLFLGGDDDLGNLGLACRGCNGRKAGKALESAGMSIVVPSAARAHEGYKPRTLCAAGSDDDLRNEMRTPAHNRAPVRNDKNAPLSSFLNSEEKKHSEKKEKREANRGSRLPDNWDPPAADLEAAIALIGATRADDELAKFRDHWKALPGSKGVKTDWPATWRNWYRRAHEYGGNRNGNGTGANRNSAAAGGGQSGSTAILAGVAAATERRARERSAAGQQNGQPPGNGGFASDDDLELFGAERR